VTQQRTKQQIHDDIARNLASASVEMHSEPAADPAGRNAIKALHEVVTDLALLQGVDIS